MKGNETLKYLHPENPADVEQFYANVQMGLHAAAQPLTVLRGALWPEAVEGMAASELRELAEVSATAVERTCILFHLTRELLNAESIRPSSHQFDLCSVLKDTTERIASKFEEAGADLEVVLDDPLPLALGDADVASQAIAAALSFAASIAVSGDAVTLRACEVDCEIEVAVEVVDSPAPAVEADVKLRLALLRSLLRKQCATLVYEPNPFHLRMRFKQVQDSIRSHIA